MRNVTPETLTEAFLGYCSTDTDPRLKFLLERLAHHLHGFVRETNLSHAEWRKGIELLTAAGNISTPERNEFVLFSDILGISSLVDMVNSPPEATASSVLGPFHILDAPELPVGGDLLKDNDGDSVIVQGRVLDTVGNPIGGAVIDIWQTASNGLYSNQDPEQDYYNFRARMRTGADGRYAFTTVRPAPYTVPDDGPAGEMLRATGRHPWRPSHLHFIIAADRHQTLVTEVFPDDDPYLDEDAVFGVREDLIMKYRRCDDPQQAPRDIVARDVLTDPFYIVDFDFILADKE
jgi:protocatechuate 3,4-dioxygenase beta subunit